MPKISTLSVIIGEDDIMLYYNANAGCLSSTLLFYQEFFMRAPYIPMDTQDDVNLMESCYPTSKDLTPEDYRYDMPQYALYPGFHHIWNIPELKSHHIKQMLSIFHQWYSLVKLLIGLLQNSFLARIVKVLIYLIFMF